MTRDPACSICSHWPENHSGKNGEHCDRCPGLTCQQPDRVIIETLTSDELESIIGAIESEIRQWMGEFSVEQAHTDIELVFERIKKIGDGPPFESDEEMEMRAVCIEDWNGMLTKLKKVLEDHYEKDGE